jgi:hypothetical protein
MVNVLGFGLGVGHAGGIEPSTACGCRKLGFVSEQQKSSYGFAPLLLG